MDNWTEDDNRTDDDNDDNTAYDEDDQTDDNNDDDKTEDNDGQTEYNDHSMLRLSYFTSYSLALSVKCQSFLKSPQYQLPL